MNHAETKFACQLARPAIENAAEFNFDSNVNVRVLVGGKVDWEHAYLCREQVQSLRDQLTEWLEATV